MRWVLSVLLCFLFCLPVTYAEEPSRVRYKLPVVETNNKGEKCLDVNEWRQVILVATEYKRHFDWRLQIEPVLLQYKANDATYGKLIAGYQQQISYLEKEREGLRLQLIESEKFKLKLQKGHRIEKGFMWAVIVLEAAVIGFLGIRSAVTP